MKYENQSIGKVTDDRSTKVDAFIIEVMTGIERAKVKFEAKEDEHKDRSD